MRLNQLGRAIVPKPSYRSHDHKYWQGRAASKDVMHPAAQKASGKYTALHGLFLFPYTRYPLGWDKGKKELTMEKSELQGNFTEELNII